jgi:hypothetical protein
MLDIQRYINVKKVLALENKPISQPLTGNFFLNSK